MGPDEGGPWRWHGAGQGKPLVWPSAARRAPIGGTGQERWEEARRALVGGMALGDKAGCGIWPRTMGAMEFGMGRGKEEDGAVEFGVCAVGEQGTR